MADDDELLSVNEVAARMRAHPETIRRWLKTGRIHGFLPGDNKLGWRIPASELDRLRVHRAARGTG